MLHDAKLVGLLYDPPDGWRYDFPKKYLPEPGETFVETLIRDGYPAQRADWASKYIRFIGEL